MPAADDTRAVYAAEQQFTAWLDAGSRTPGTPLRIRVGAATVEFEPEVEPRFSTPADVQPYVDRVLTHLRSTGSRYDDGEVDLATRPVVVRDRRGAARAHYEYPTPGQPGVIALPPRERGGAWSLRGTVVLHELAHHLAGHPGHGPLFRTTFLRLLEDLGMPVAAELLHTAFRQGGLDTGIDGEDRTLLRIGRLLRQAERAANEAERDAFFSKAQSLATRHQIALAVARATAGAREQREEPLWETVPIGERGTRSLARYVRLMIEVARANDVRVTIFTSNTRVTLYGFPTDIAVVKALYTSLVTQMVSDGDAHLRSGAHRRDLRHVWNDKSRAWERRPVHGATARAAFYEAWADHVGARLASAREAAHRAAIAADEPVPDGQTTTQLALRSREIELVDHFDRMRREHGVRGTWKGAASAGHAAPGSRQAGIAAAARAHLGSEPAIERPSRSGGKP